MASDGNDQMLIKIAVFGLTMSIIATAMIAVLISPNNDYSYDEVAAYRNELVSFSGNTMVNSTPWVLTHAYTPWVPSMGVQYHMDNDGWLFGEDVAYSEIGKAANIALDVDHKSTTLISVGNKEGYSYASGREWWAGDNWFGWDISGVTDFFGIDSNTYTSGTANTWNYTGYRYTFDPTLPFGNGVSSKDGTLSVVWYTFGGHEGLSGGLDVYSGSKPNGDVILASYDAVDIIAGYESVGGYAANYDFDFDGYHLQLSIKFDPTKTATHTLMECWVNGWWTMAISSVSAGNFYDVENSTAFVSTAGSLIDTFKSIYTFSMPSISNPWMDLILWLLVALPMTIALLCITLKFVQSIKIL